MDKVIEKTKTQRLMKYWPYAAGGSLLLVMLVWLIFGNHASTLKVNKDELTVSDVQRAEFKDYVRTNGQVLPIQVVQISPEEGGIVMEKVVEEGTHVKKGDVIARLSNSNLDLQILNAEAELAEKQNLLRNTQVAMQQDRLKNQTEQAQLDMDTQRKQRNFEQNKRLYQEKLISKEDYIKSALSGETHQQGGLHQVAGGLSALCQEAAADCQAPEARLYLSHRSDGPDGG